MALRQIRNCFAGIKVTDVSLLLVQPDCFGSVVFAQEQKDKTLSMCIHMRRIPLDSQGRLTGLVGHVLR